MEKDKKIYLTLKDLYDIRLAEVELHSGGRSFLNKRLSIGIEYDQSRAYIFGDNARSIDWRASNKGKGLFTKIYKEDFHNPQYLVVEQDSSMFFSTGERFKSFLAGMFSGELAWTIHAKKNPLGYFIFDDDRFIYSPSSSSEENLAVFFRELVKFNNKLNLELLKTKARDKNQLTEILHFCYQKKLKGNFLLIVDFASLNKSNLDLIKIIQSSGCNTTIFAIADKIEASLDLAEDITIFDGRENYFLDSNDDVLAQNWQEHFTAKKQELEDFANRYNCSFEVIFC